MSSSLKLETVAIIPYTQIASLYSLILPLILALCMWDVLVCTFLRDAFI